MTVADRLTGTRIILAPLFYIMYFLPAWLGAGLTWTVPVLWVIFIAAELTDMLDGMAARHLNQVSGFGRLFDPFADTLLQLTCFLCFVIDGIFPAALFLIVVYREFSVLFIRNLMLRKGIAMGARMGGKIKTGAYVTAAAVALLYASLRRLNMAECTQTVVGFVAVAVFGISVILSIVSFIDYLLVYRNSDKKSA